MSMQFLPWTRRGLAAELTTTDDGGALPARAAFGVNVQVNGQSALTDIDAYGPGDIAGLDVATIARTVPRRFAANVAPDELAAVEFTEPDLPWAFTPAVAGTDGHLRPWLVLVVVAQAEGVRIAVDRARALPSLVIEAPAVAADELPDLSQSWAWAHTQVVTAARTDDPVAALRTPAQRVSRILCPRRLEPTVRYLAALVPAFDLGVDAGLGRPARGAELGPAWDLATLGDRFELPVYYHWEFTTGPAGDFESLARQLQPMPLPAGVGRAPMYVGAAHPALPDVAPDAGGIVAMEGALRTPGPEDALPSSLATWTDDLVGLVNATATRATDGTAADAEAVAPPIYGEWPAAVHQVPAVTARPRWLRDLNADPRSRVAAGLGAEVVRANQETYVDAAWQQVGDVLRANVLLNLGRAMAAIEDRLHERHVLPIAPELALPFAAPTLDRIRLGDRPLGDVVRRSAALPGAVSRPLRRLAAPRSMALRVGLRRFDRDLALPGRAPTTAIGRLATGAAALPVAVTPDGIRATKLPQLAREGLDEASVDAVQITELTAALERQLRSIADAAMPPVTVRPDLATTGVVTDLEIDRLRGVADLRTDLVSAVAALREPVVRPGTGTMIGILAGPTRFAPIVAAADGTVMARVGRAKVDLTPPAASAALSPTTAPVLGAGLRAAARPDMVPGAVRRGSASAGGLVVSTAAGVPAASLAEAVVAHVATGLPRDQMAKLEALGAATGEVVAIALPSTAGTALAAYSDAAQRRSVSIEQLLGVTAPAAPPPTLDLDAVAAAVVLETAPRPVIEARVQRRLRAGGQSLADWPAGRIGLHQADQMAPIMVGPVLERALYLDLAGFDQGRFLPGAGAIPDNALTLLETNPRFVEAFLVGANHELGRELLWRRYPTDRRGTPFRRFWDRVPVDGAVPDDIAPIHKWRRANRLGSNALGDADGTVVLLVRGQLLRRYPNTVVYAVAATADRRIDLTADPKPPVFAGFLEPDIAFAGFDFDVDAARAGHGTMFVLQEQPSEPRFGLDVPTGGTALQPPAAWSDMSWGHVGVEPGGFLDVDVFGGLPDRPLDAAVPAVSARFVADAGHLAAITFQRPFRAAVHSSEVLG